MPSNASPCVTFDDIVAARRRIADRLVLSALVSADALSETAKAKVFFKLESMQQTGSYKERGALNRLLLTPREQLDCGVVAASAGNHAQALALHATRLGVKATIVMPEASPLIKVTGVRAHGAKVVLHGANFDEALAEAKRRCEAEGLVFIHPFDDAAVIAGQGTLGLEILEQVPSVDTLLVPVGGGGLIGGIAAADRPGTIDDFHAGDMRPGLTAVSTRIHGERPAERARDTDEETRRTELPTCTLTRDAGARDTGFAPDRAIVTLLERGQRPVHRDDCATQAAITHQQVAAEAHPSDGHARRQHTHELGEIATVTRLEPEFGGATNMPRGVPRHRLITQQTTCEAVHDIRG
jgi:hypothetical protein